MTQYMVYWRYKTIGRRPLMASKVFKAKDIVDLRAQVLHHIGPGRFFFKQLVN